MTQPQRVTEAEAVAAALHVYADAVRYGHTPTPNFVSLHAAGLPLDMFLALADRTDALITIIDPPEDAKWRAYARIALPFGAGILPTSIDASAHATCSITDDAMRRDIATHNAECVNPCANGCDAPELHAEGGHDR